jgi:hypothetical protein
MGWFILNSVLIVWSTMVGKGMQSHAPVEGRIPEGGLCPWSGKGPSFLSKVGWLRLLLAR